MRAFIAIDLPSHIREEIITLQDILGSQLAGNYRFPKPSQLHLTLKFLGKIDAKGLEYFQEFLEKTCSSHAPFRLSLEKLGSFGRPPRIAWLGLAGEKKKLYALQNAIAKEEDRSFQAHITVARVTRPPKGKQLEHYLHTLKSLKPQELSWHIEEVILYHSQLKATGAEHGAIGRFALNKGKRSAKNKDKP